MQGERTYDIAATGKTPDRASAARHVSQILAQEYRANQEAFERSAMDHTRLRTEIVELSEPLRQEVLKYAMLCRDSGDTPEALLIEVKRLCASTPGVRNADIARAFTEAVITCSIEGYYSPQR